LVSIARQSIQITTPYFVPDPLLMSLLAKATGRGVRVQVLTAGEHHDSTVSQLTSYPCIEQMLANDVEVYQYAKTMLHAKTMVVDDLVCCLGSANWNRRSLGKDEECCAVTLCANTAGALRRRLDHDCAFATALDHTAWSNRSWWTKLKETVAGVVAEQT